MKSDVDSNIKIDGGFTGALRDKIKPGIDIRAFTMIGALILIWIIFGIITNGKYISSRNLSLLVRQMTITAVLTTGVTLLIIAGHIDLSLGSVVGLTGGIGAILQIKMGWSPVTAIIVVLLAGVLIGLWHGFWVALQNVPAFIVTLGGLMIFRGILLGISHGRTVSPFSQNYRIIGQGYLNQTTGLVIAVAVSILFVILQLSERHKRIGYGFNTDSTAVFSIKTVFYCALIIGATLFLNAYEGIPVPVVILIILAAILIFISTKTKFGRHVYAMGDNLEAARLSGINTTRLTMILFVISGLFAAIAGIILTARLNAAPTSAGLGAEMDAVAAAVIGGTSLMGGVGSIPGAIVGALVMASLDNGMSLMNVDVFYQQIIKGLILILAVWFDVKSKK